jgi:hypothetical protein
MPHRAGAAAITAVPTVDVPACRRLCGPTPFDGEGLSYQPRRQSLNVPGIHGEPDLVQCKVEFCLEGSNLSVTSETSVLTVGVKLQLSGQISALRMVGNKIAVGSH